MRFLYRRRIEEEVLIEAPDEITALDALARYEQVDEAHEEQLRAVVLELRRVAGRFVRF